MRKVIIVVFTRVRFSRKNKKNKITCFFSQLRQHDWSPRILLGGFDNNRISTRNGQREHPQRNHGREIEGTDSGSHSNRDSIGQGIHISGHVAQSLTLHERRHRTGVFYHLNRTILFASDMFSNTWRPRLTSPSASGSVLPCSWVIFAASFFRSLLIRCCRLNIHCCLVKGDL